MDIVQKIHEISQNTECNLFNPSGNPRININHTLPNDLKVFYELCGGMTLFQSKNYSSIFLPPNELVLANPVIIGDLCEEDISSSWYIVCKTDNSEFLTIDLSPERLGRCYDSFYDRHGVAGSCPIIAQSFTELLTRIYDSKGEYWYWLSSGFNSLGDAYD